MQRISAAILVCSLLCAAARAEPAEEESASEAASRWTLGLRGFGGVLISEGEARGGGGGSALVGLNVVPERWEIELGLSALGSHTGPVGIFELAGKRLLEKRGKWAPHILLGPVFSLDFGDDLKPSGGLLVGGGVTHWLSGRVGIVGDGSYRLLIGAEIEDVLTVAVGLSFRL